MNTLIYLHGFLSSPASTKAVQTREWLHQQGLPVQYLCPFLSPYPSDTRSQLDALLGKLLEQVPTEQIGVVGSSLGGYWATYLVEAYGVRAVLINPSVRPYDMVENYLGQSLGNYYTEDVYEMLPEHAQQLRDIDFPHPVKNDNYWLLAQTGDETLDYRLAEAKYRHCNQLIEEGGDHSFQGYVDRLPAILSFLFGHSVSVF